MNKKFIIGLLFLLAGFSSVSLYAQADTVKNVQQDTVKKAPVYKIGIFAPLYLDSVFTKNTFRYKQSIPRFILPAVEFVQGALLALDSLNAGDDYIEAAIYDTKSYTENVPDLIRRKKLDSLQLIIGSVKDDEYFQLADFALQKNIPFISVTYPNDAGINGNPFLVIMNSTLKSHCEAIYSYILQNHGTDKIYLCRQKGTQEDMVASFFKEINEKEGKPLLPIETLNLDNKLTAAYLKSKLDSNRKSILIGASLDEKFAENLARSSFELYKTYPISLIGMPNWDNFSLLFNKKEMVDFPVYYTSPYFNEKLDPYSKSVNAVYFNKYRVKPSDMAFKGYESVYLFTKLLIKNPDNFMNNINDKGLKVFCEYNFKAVRRQAEIGIPDYFENKHMYLIKILNGNTSKAW